MMNDEENVMHFSPQAVGAIMMAVQKGMLAAAEDRPREECDISSILANFQLRKTMSGIMVLNPPTLNFDLLDEKDDEESEEV